MSRWRPILNAGFFLTLWGTQPLSAQFARENNTVGITFPGQNFQGFIYNDSGNRETVNFNRRPVSPRRGDTFRESQARGSAAQSSSPTVDPRLIAEQGLRDPFIGPPARLPPVSQRIALPQPRNRSDLVNTPKQERYARDPFERRLANRSLEHPWQVPLYDDAPRVVTNPAFRPAAQRDLPPQSREARAYPFLNERQ